MTSKVTTFKIEYIHVHSSTLAFVGMRCDNDPAMFAAYVPVTEATQGSKAVADWFNFTFKKFNCLELFKIGDNKRNLCLLHPESEDYIYNPKVTMTGAFQFV